MNDMTAMTENRTITPTPISGFPEFLPQVQVLFNHAADVVRRHFELAGAVPIETPSVEREEVLTSKGGNEKEIYAMTRLAASDEREDGGRKALRFDLTVPLARYVAQHYHELAFPFRRYQMQTVWRGERAQAGRYREFKQWDIDVIGDGALDILHDAEMPAIIYGAFSELGIGPFMIRLNNRKILSGYYAHLGLEGTAAKEAMRVVDKLEKTGSAKVIDDLVNGGLSHAAAMGLVDLSRMSGDPTAVISRLNDWKVNALFEQGVEELTTVCNAVADLGVPSSHFCADLGIVRGLDYYTGTIYETRLIEHPGIGSICSGGRYDDLASHFTKRKLPGVGISIGITRLLPRLIQAGVMKPAGATLAPVLITSLDRSRMTQYLALAGTLRRAGIGAEVYMEESRLGEQLKFATRKGFRIALIAGENEFAKGSILVKNLGTGTEVQVTSADVVSLVQDIITAKKETML